MSTVAGEQIITNTMIISASITATATIIASPSTIIYHHLLTGGSGLGGREGCLVSGRISVEVEVSLSMTS